MLRRMFVGVLFLCSFSVSAAPLISVLSNRADLISGGDVLIEISNVVDAGSLQVRVDGRDVSGAFALRENGRYMGLVEGLALGKNTLRVSGAGGTEKVVITNHPNHGPVFSAYQHRLVPCETEGEKPADCDLQVSYKYLYKSNDPSQTDLVEFDPNNGAPADVAMTTTQTGSTLPFIVRREDGFQDRDRYTLLVLYDLSAESEWDAWNPQAQFNGKMFITHGGNCGMSFNPSNPLLGDTSGSVGPGLPKHSYITALSQGFAVMATALNNLGHNCDVVLMAESMMMAKERFIEQYGELRYTIGTGCSGGAIAQLIVANSYPGIYQGLITTCTYPDALTPAVKASDYDLLRTYFEDPSRWAPGVVWSPHQFARVEGHVSHVNAVTMDELLWTGATDVDSGCAGDQTYHPTENPDGIRCGAIEWYKHVFGERLAPAKTGDGKLIQVARTPAGNIGIQYGLKALQAGEITPAQFVDLNLKVGGLDYDIVWQPERWTGSPDGNVDSIVRAFRSGAINQGNNLNQVAIINFLGPDPGIAHDSLHAWWMRWRLDRVQGHHKNHVMWGGPWPVFADPYYFDKALFAMDRWLAAVEADTTSDPMLVKIAGNRPEDVHDQCSDGRGNKVSDEFCVELQRYAYNYETPRVVAGADKYATNVECRLKPLDRNGDYGPVPLTDEQWTSLESVFADGICDYQRPGHGETENTVPWLTYRDEDGDVIVGGDPMPPVPDNSMGGWFSPVFAQ